MTEIETKVFSVAAVFQSGYQTTRLPHLLRAQAVQALCARAPILLKSNSCRLAGVSFTSRDLEEIAIGTGESVQVEVRAFLGGTVANSSFRPSDIVGWARIPSRSTVYGR
jgi:hypothetical protein